MKPTVLHVGLGTIGQEIVKAALAGGRGTPVAGVDPLHGGRSLGEIVPGAPQQAPIHAALHEIPDKIADVAVLATASKVEDMAEDLLALISRGYNCVSTCEKLSYPWLDSPQLAARIDRAARDNGVTVVGTGVNPGFILDALPVMLTRPCTTVKSITARRVVNTTRRRRQLQEKTGCGLSPEDFIEKAKNHAVGHVGLPESLALIARGMGWTINSDDIDLSIEPVIAEKAVSSEFFTVAAGQVRGQSQVAQAHRNDLTLRIELRMALDETGEYDEIIIEGTPPVHTVIKGGVFGDTATAGCTVNVLRQTVAAPPGLSTVVDLGVS